MCHHLEEEMKIRELLLITLSAGLILLSGCGAEQNPTVTEAVSYTHLETKETPFQLKNYQADVKLQTVTFKEEQTDVYLYTCLLYTSRCV